MSVHPFGGVEPKPASPLGALLLGVGLGGFVDGIVLHQLLQWHHMLTADGREPANTVAGLEANTLADGLFHVLTLLFVVAGVLVLERDWRAGRRSPPWPAFVALLLVGWGAFNLVEGVINHHLLELHHVRDDVADSTWWDLGFLGSGALMLILGGTLAERTWHSHSRIRETRRFGEPA
jgi:uncharacterized membrane protein